MKRYALIILLLILPVLSFADDIQFNWDYENDSAIDGFRIYSGPMGQLADGTWLPRYAEDPIANDIPPGAREYIATENGWEGVAKKWCFMARSFRGDKESPDSNYVCTIIDNTPIAYPVDLSASYNDELSQISLSWSQNDDFDRTKYWIVYYKLPDDEAFTALGEVANSGSSDLKMNVAFNAVPAGKLVDVSMVVVAFKNNEVYSANSDETVVTVDRLGAISEPNNFRFKLLIDVK